MSVLKNEPGHRYGGSLTGKVEVTSFTNRLALTPEEVARLLGLHPNSVYAMLKNGTLPAVKAGRKWLISKRRFDTWLDGEDET